MLSPDYDIKLGQWMKSDAVGAAGEFVGEVVKLLADGGVHLKDSAGRLWARERATLSVVSKPAAVAKKD